MKEYRGLPVSILRYSVCGGVPTWSLAKYAVRPSSRDNGTVMTPAGVLAAVAKPDRTTAAAAAARVRLSILMMRAISQYQE